MPGKGNPRFTTRLPREYVLAIRLEARKPGVSVSKHLRGILREYSERVSDTQSSGVGHLENLTRTAKQFIVAARLSRQEGPYKVSMKDEKTAGLPGTEKRGELEKLVWQGIQEAVLYSKTEHAAKEAEARLLALRVANGIAVVAFAALAASLWVLEGTCRGKGNPFCRPACRGPTSSLYDWRLEAKASLSPSMYATL